MGNTTYTGTRDLARTVYLEGLDIHMNVAIKYPRTLWLSGLSALPGTEVIDLAQHISADWEIHPQHPSQSGLAMLQLRDSVAHENFYLGEFPLAHAHVVIIVNNESVHGTAQLMSDDQELAEALAICDAVLAHSLPSWSQVNALLEKGMTIRQRQQAIRDSMLNKTHVDFSLLDNAVDADDD